jgi:hypothetical protein
MRKYETMDPLLQPRLNMQQLQQVFGLYLEPVLPVLLPWAERMGYAE